MRPTEATPPRSQGGAAAAAVSLLVIVLFAATAVYFRRPPAAVPAAAPADEFSAGRAMKHVRELAQAPHPVGTAEHARVEQYLRAELAALGVEPQVQETTAVSTSRNAPVYAGTVHNVLARLAGTEHGRAVLLVAHYDSAPASRGANDDGAGVAAMLETLRALKAGPPLRNDVLFLFSDGEEVGSLGARAFVEQHPWAREVAVVVNLEARGNRGPSMMFETSEGNGWLVGQLAGVSRPSASSLMYEVYRVMPNDTDLTVFKKAGYAGYNFAYIDGPTHYHTGLDTAESVDEGSLQQQGGNMLSLARRLGGGDLTQTKAHDSVYFDLLGLGLVHYPGALTLPLAAVAALGFLVVLVWGLRRGTLGALKVVGGALASLAAVLLAAVATFAAVALTQAVAGGAWTPDGYSYHWGLLTAGFAAVALAAASGVVLLCRRRLGVANIAAGALIWWAALAVLTALGMPGASYLFTWPLLFAAAALALTLRRAEGAGQAVRPALLLSLCAGPALILFVPVVLLIAVALPLSVAFIPAVLVGLLTALLVPQLDAVGAGRRWPLPAAALCAAVLLFGVVSAAARREPSGPKQNTLFYGLDADAARAFWATGDGQADEWTAQFINGSRRSTLSEFFPFGAREFLNSEAPVATLQAPAVEVASDAREGDVRTLRLRVTSPRQAPVVLLSASARVLGAEVNGRPVDMKALPPSDRPEKGFGLNFFGLPAEGVEIVLRVAAAEPLNLRVVDRSYALPEIPGLAMKARPDYMISSPYSYSDATLVSKTYSF
ncbi:MAG: M20/M25/M40 family metallo-hydrolase [Acidobacteria bacterium]|nr:M20/M25/M40 family metallo-hydrolase [Acidobacteriota bacterium]